MLANSTNIFTSLLQ